jgi:Transglutaminase-like superfamily
VALLARMLDNLPAQEDAGAISRDREWPPGPLPAATKPGFISNCFLFLRILVFAAGIPCLLRMKLSKVAEVLEPGSDPSDVEEQRVQKIAGYVERAIRDAKPFVRPGCLTRGLTRYYFLRRAGLDVTLCFGMGGADRDFTGHCWLEKDGEPFLEGDDPRSLYAEMYRVSRAGGRASTANGASGLRSPSKS